MLNMETLNALPLSCQMHILSFLGEKTQSEIFKDEHHQRLPPVKFTIKSEIPPTHVLSQTDLLELESRGYLVKDSFLGQEMLQKFRSNAAQLFKKGKLKPAGMGTGAEHWKAEPLRSDHILWLNSISEPTEDDDLFSLRELVASILKIQTQLNETTDFDSQSNQIQLTCYPGKKTRYIRHLDAHVGSPNRRITCLYYMNPDWKKEDGGELRIYDVEGDGHVDIEPSGDRLLIFQSRLLEHEVLETHQERYALTVWFY